MIFIKRFQYLDIDCNVYITIKRSNKRIYLRVKNGDIYFTSPVKLTDDYILNMVKNNYNSIIKAIKKAPPVKTNKLHLFGYEYDVVINKSTYNNVYVMDNEIHVYTKRIDDEYIKRIVHLFYANRLAQFVEKNIDEVKRKFNIEFNITLQYKNVKTYFAKCYSKRRHVVFSTNLCRYDEYYILSVIYHELAHFYHQNHGMQFYNLLEQKFPNYKKAQSNLRKIKYNDIY